MPSAPRIEQNEEQYWELARSFVRVLIDDLNGALKECGLSKPKRRAAVEKASFALCNMFDQGWLRADGLTAYPMLVFSKKFLDSNVSIDQASPFQLRHESVELHAMVCDEIRWYFDEQKERIPDNTSGDVGCEVPDEIVTRKAEAPAFRPQCHICKGTGACYCIRKEPGSTPACSRCSGSGKCRHCKGVGHT